MKTRFSTIRRHGSTRLHPDEIDGVMADINAHLEGRTSHFETEHRMLHAERHIPLDAHERTCRS